MANALLVVDVQEAYLGEGRNKKQFSYEKVDQLIEKINDAIEEHIQEGWEIIYIAEVIPNTQWGRLLFRHSLEGTEGAKLYKKLQVLSKNYFEKIMPDAFSIKELRTFIRENHIDTVHICGIDEVGCVAETAKGAAKLGLKVKILKEAVDSVFSTKKVEKTRTRLREKNIYYI